MAVYLPRCCRRLLVLRQVSRLLPAMSNVAYFYQRTEINIHMLKELKGR
jgi:hypothetical protein